MPLPEMPDLDDWLIIGLDPSDSGTNMSGFSASSSQYDNDNPVVAGRLTVDLHQLVLSDNHIGIFDGGWLFRLQGLLYVPLSVSHGLADLIGDLIMQFFLHPLWGIGRNVALLDSLVRVDPSVEELLSGTLEVHG